MKKNKKVSIIIPIYNTEKYLEKCLESVIKQTYQNIEVILINDGSKDNSGQICDRFSIIDKRIKVIHSKNNGVSVARNIGIENSTGEYVTFIDADDYVSDNYIEFLYTLLSENKADMSIIGNDETYNSSIIKVNNKLKKILTTEEVICKILEEKYITAVCWGKLYKKDLIIANQIKFDRDLKIGEDFKFIMEFIEKSNKVAVDTTQNLYHYRLNEESVTQQEGREKDWIKEIQLSNEIINWIEKKYPKLKMSAMQRYIRTNITYYTKSIKNNNNRALKDLKLFKKNIKGFKFKYLFITSASFKYKVKFLFLVVCPRLLSYLYKIKK